MSGRVPIALGDQSIRGEDLIESVRELLG